MIVSERIAVRGWVKKTRKNTKNIEKQTSSRTHIHFMPIRLVRVM